MIRWLRTLALRALGSVLSVEGREALVEEAMLALEAGVTLSLREWEALSQVEQAAWVCAGKRRAAVTAATVGVASQGLQHAALVAEPADGGAMLKAVENAQEAARQRSALESAARDLAKTRMSGAP